MGRTSLAALTTCALVMSFSTPAVSHGTEADALADGQRLEFHDRGIAVTIPAAWDVTTGSQGLPIFERLFVAREPDGFGRCFVETFAFDGARSEAIAQTLSSIRGYRKATIAPTIALPVGDVVRLYAPELPGEGQGFTADSYDFEAEDGYAWLTCSTTGSYPGHLWYTIAASIRLLDTGARSQAEAAQPSAQGQAGAVLEDDGVRTTEIPGTGLAVTLPGEWRVWSQPASGVSAVIASDVRTRRSCGFDLVPDARSAEEAARDMLETLEANRQVVVLDHSSVSARAGDAVRVSYRMTSLPDEPRFMIHEYYVTGPAGVASVSCQDVDPPTDRWLSVVDALEVAGVEDVTPAPFDPRVEVPQHGFAVELGAEWLVRDWAGPGALLGGIAEDGAMPQVQTTAALRLTTIGDGMMDQECFVEDGTGDGGLPGVESLDEWREVLAATDGSRDRQSSAPEVSGVDLGSDRVVRADWTRWRGVPATAWVFADDERRVVLFCRAEEPPADRWRSIAETFEFLPADPSRSGPAERS